MDTQTAFLAAVTWLLAAIVLLLATVVERLYSMQQGITLPSSVGTQIDILSAVAVVILIVVPVYVAYDVVASRSSADARSV